MTARSFVKALAFAGALMPLAASATLVMRLSMEEMTQRSLLVVRGTVQSTRAMATDNGSIWTLTSLRVSERLKGVAQNQLTIKQPGGEVAGRAQRASGAAQFVEGEEVVVFLEPAADEKNAFVVLGLASGKVSFEVVNGQKMAVRHLDGLSFASPGTRRIEPIEALEKLGSPEAFLARIRLAATHPSTLRGVK